jgi:hypothetical protein
MSNSDFLSWNDEIQDDGGSSFVVLPEGEYKFEVHGLEKGTYQGPSEKIGMGCPMAILSIKVLSPNGNADVKDTVYLKKSLEWKASSFFRSIGQKKHGKKFVMNWKDENIIGQTGKCRIKVDKWIDKEGKERQSNKIDSYLDADGEDDLSMPFPID